MVKGKKAETTPRKTTKGTRRRASKKNTGISVSFLPNNQQDTNPSLVKKSRWAQCKNLVDIKYKDVDFNTTNNNNNVFLGWCNGCHNIKKACDRLEEHRTFKAMQV